MCFLYCFRARPGGRHPHLLQRMWSAANVFDVFMFLIRSIGLFIEHAYIIAYILAYIRASILAFIFASILP